MTKIFHTGNPIWVYYTDIDSGNNLQVPRLLRGETGATFTVEPPAIPRYKFFKATGPLSGTFSDRQQTIHLYYRQANWHKTKTVTRFLKTRQPVAVYDGVAGMAVDQIPAGLVIRASQLVETADHQVWYQVNADQWIPATKDTVTVLEQDPYQDQPVTVHPKWEADMTVLKLNHQLATVDYVPVDQLDVYDQVYGQPVATVTDGQALTLISQVDDANGVRWYETADHYFINGAYVHREEDPADE